MPSNAARAEATPTPIDPPDRAGLDVLGHAVRGAGGPNPELDRAILKALGRGGPGDVETIDRLRRRQPSPSCNIDDAVHCIVLPRGFLWSRNFDGDHWVRANPDDTAAAGIPANAVFLGDRGPSDALTLVSAVIKAERARLS